MNIERGVIGMTSSLKDLKVKELRDLAKTFNIVGRWDMNKAELITAIEKAKSQLQEGMSVESIENVSVEKDNKNKIISDNPRKECAEDMNKKTYINNMSVGTLVAFKTKGKVKSAKIIKKSTKNELALVETKVGKQYRINYDDIVWVKTGKRWPRGVYNLLKGIEVLKDAE